MAEDSESVESAVGSLTHCSLGWLAAWCPGAGSAAKVGANPATAAHPVYPLPLFAS